MLESWEIAYRSAMLETDRQKVAGKIDSAVVVLRARLLELNSSLDDKIQRERIEDAMRTLEVVRRMEAKLSA
jgi:hypothetical protein